MRGIDEDDGAGLGSGMAGARVSHFIFFLFWLSEFGNVSFLTTSFHMIFLFSSDLLGHLKWRFHLITHIILLVCGKDFWIPLLVCFVWFEGLRRDLCCKCFDLCVSPLVFSLIFSILFQPVVSFYCLFKHSVEQHLSCFCRHCIGFWTVYLIFWLLITSHGNCFSVIEYNLHQSSAICF